MLKTFLRFIYFYVMCIVVCMCVCVPRAYNALGGQKEAELQVLAIIWVLGFETGSSGRTVNALLNCSAISPVNFIHFNIH